MGVVTRANSSGVPPRRPRISSASDSTIKMSAVGGVGGVDRVANGAGSLVAADGRLGGVDPRLDDLVAPEPAEGRIAAGRIGDRTQQRRVGLEVTAGLEHVAFDDVRGADGAGEAEPVGRAGLEVAEQCLEQRSQDVVDAVELSVERGAGDAGLTHDGEDVEAVRPLVE